MDDPFDKHLDDELVLDPNRKVPVQTNNRPRPEHGEESAPDDLQQPGSIPEGLG